MMHDPREAWLSEIAILMSTTPGTYPPGGTPAQPAPEPTAPPPVARPRYVQFGGYEVCARCNYAREFCGCDKQPPPPPTTGDGVDSSLNKRVRELRRGRT
jgi:hypothetical protein